MKQVRGALLACPEDVFLRMLQCPETALAGTGGKGLQQNIPSCNQALGHAHAVRRGSDLYLLEQGATLHSGMGFGPLPLCHFRLQWLPWHCCHSTEAPDWVLCPQCPPCSVTRDQLSVLLQFVLLGSGQHECSVIGD